MAHPRCGGPHRNRGTRRTRQHLHRGLRRPRPPDRPPQDMAAAAEDRAGGAATVARLSVEALRALGVDTLFCLPGVQNDDFFDALVDARDIRPVVTRHEQGAAYMALGAAQVTARPAALCVVPGPGMLNAAAGLTSAYWGNARVLALIGAVPSGLRGRSTGILHDLPDPAAVLRQLTKHTGYVGSGLAAVGVWQPAIDARA
ncbi:MAG: hypothetical protein F4017_04095, partial [Acidimicrobiaceae bacterium]|nr:hypothetical protein [Acidimicrobiaceae bacterium]